jgi:sulfur-oxidizing protein SoxZ
MKKLILALESIALMATAAMADAPAATEVKMKIKAKEKDGTVKAKVAISHNMLTYDQAKKKGKEANFITHITATVGDKVVYDASTSQFLSKNPLIKFSFAVKKVMNLKSHIHNLNVKYSSQLRKSNKLIFFFHTVSLYGKNIKIK